MKEDIKELWIAALRSNRFKQGNRVLTNVSEGTNCCLGVLCELALDEGLTLPFVDEMDSIADHPGGPEKRGLVRVYDGERWYLPYAVAMWAGLTDNQRRGELDPKWEKERRDYTKKSPSNVAVLNDDGATFEEIADVIEKRA